MSTEEADVVSVMLEGRITAETAAPIWQSAIRTLECNPTRPIVVDASRIQHVDNIGLALLFDLIRHERPPGARVEIRGLASKLDSMVRRHDPLEFAEPFAGRPAVGAIEMVGRATARQIVYLRELTGFIGACVHAVFTGRTRRAARLGDVLDVATETGANAVPIVLLVGFLMGVIMAFELGLVARQFGAVIFVVNGVGVAVLRELGALMTAIVVAGRTGAAFAAQIGAQKVNEELDALSTFGLDPVQFLVLPRLLASILVVPMLAALADVVGLLGGALVMTTFDVTFLQFYTQLLGAVTVWDLMLGLIKAAFFGVTIAAVGCHSGLTTGAGATAVGQSATHAVVASIVLVIVIDGFFAVFTS
ncbi:MAG: ABC transporter permease [Steroidobacteraceae bacterium]